MYGTVVTRKEGLSCVESTQLALALQTLDAGICRLDRRSRRRRRRRRSGTVPV